MSVNVEGEVAESTVTAEETESIPDNVTELNGPRKMTKQEQKKQQIFMDRMKRHMAKGMSPEAASVQIQKEDYDALPVEKKVRRLETIIANNVRGMFGDIQALRGNQDALADAMEVNFRAMGKLFKELGIDEEKQKVAFDEAEKDIVAERTAAQAQAEAKQAISNEEAEKAEVVKQVDQPGEVSIPEGADTFGE